MHEIIDLSINSVSVKFALIIECFRTTISPGAILTVQNTTLSVTEQDEDTTVDVCVVLDVTDELERDVHIEVIPSLITASKKQGVNNHEYALQKFNGFHLIHYVNHYIQIRQILAVSRFRI